MWKKIFRVGKWLAITSLCLLILVVVAPEKSQAADGDASIEDVVGLQSISLEFGKTQNQLIVKLETSDETHYLNLGLNELDTSSRGRQQFYLEAVYTTNILNTDLELALNRDSNATTHINCAALENYQKIVVTLRGPNTNAPKKWPIFDLSNKEFNASLEIPIFNGGSDRDGDCFLLRHSLVMTNTSTLSDLPIFDLTSENVGEINRDLIEKGKCNGMTLRGRGEDELQRVHSWKCIDDVSFNIDSSFANLPSQYSDFLVFVEGSQGDGNRDWGNNHCGGRILVDGDGLVNGDEMVNIIWQDWHDDCDKGQYDNRQIELKAYSYANAAVNAASEEGPPVGPPEIGNAATPTASVNNSCEFKLSGAGIGWLVCIVLDGISGVLHFVESQVNNLLTIEIENFDKETLYPAWQNLRNLATFAIVGTALFMVISTALDIGVFKNYTVKKYLPRLIVATILIQLSWILGDFLIQIFQDVGDLVAATLYAAVPGAKEHNLGAALGGGGATAFTVGAYGIYQLLVAASQATSWLVLLPPLLMGAFFFFIAWIFLVARQWIIIFLLILGPLGLGLWLLPGNDRVWNLYAKAFIYLLALYPLAKLTIAAGKIFSYLIISS